MVSAKMAGVPPDVVQALEHDSTVPASSGAVRVHQDGGAPPRMGRRVVLVPASPDATPFVDEQQIRHFRRGRDCVARQRMLDLGQLDLGQFDLGQSDLGQLAQILISVGLSRTGLSRIGLTRAGHLGQLELGQFDLGQYGLGQLA